MNISLVFELRVDDLIIILFAFIVLTVGNAASFVNRWENCRCLRINIRKG